MFARYKAYRYVRVLEDGWRHTKNLLKGTNMLDVSPWTGRERLLRGEIDKVFVFLPYLKTSDDIVLRGMRFFPLRHAKRSRSKDAAIVRELASLFFLRDDTKIIDMSYAIVDAGKLNQDIQSLDANLDNLSTLLGYLYTSPGRQPREPFLRFEHATVFRFVKSVLPGWKLGSGGSPSLSSGKFDRLQPNTSVAGFEGWTRRRENLLLTSNSRIYPPFRDFWLNFSQDLYVNIPGALGWPRVEKRMPILFSSKQSLQPALEERILRALGWCCRSAKMATEPDEALIRMAIAFETLLNLDRTAKAADLYRRISLLVGPVPRLDSWAEQFYLARSMIVHEGATPHTGFLAVDAENASAAWRGKTQVAPFRRLVDYARLLFRPCVQAALWGGVSSFDLRLKQVFFHNQQRLESICKCLRQNGLGQREPPEELRELIGSLAEARWDSDHIAQIETVVAAGRLLLDACKHQISTEESAGAGSLIDELLSHEKSMPMQEVVAKWTLLSECLEHLILRRPDPGTMDRAVSEPRDWPEILFSFSRFATTMGLKAWAYDEYEKQSDSYGSIVG